MHFNEWLEKKQNTWKVNCRGDAGQTVSNLLNHIRISDGPVKVVIDVKDEGEETMELSSKDVADVEMEQVLTIQGSEKAKKLIKALGDHGNCGHSYGIEVYNTSGKKRFGIDGDGADYVNLA